MKTKKVIYLTSLVLFFFTATNIYAQCEITDIVILNPNKIKTAIPVGGDLFWNRDKGVYVAPYVPGEPEVSSIFAAGIWLGGFNEDGNLGASCQSYGHRVNNSRADFWPGPIDDVTGEVFEGGCDQFNKVWKVEQGDVLSLIADFENNGNIDFTISQNILQWPGKGNPHFEEEIGFVLPDQELAPFFDRNGNGIYEPMNGEYPIIDEAWPSIIPNELTWCVYNDIEGAQQETGGNPVGVEIHQLVYGFNCGDSEVLSQTIFTRHKIINKSGGNITGLRTGIWTDYSIGCYADDAFGCDTLSNTVYFYNLTEEDGSFGCVNQEINYQGTPPVQAMTYLNHDMSKVGYYENSPLVILINTYRPEDDEEHYNYLSGKWREGVPLTYGWNGFNPNSIEIVNFPFFDNPNNPDGWSAYQEPFLPIYERTPIPSYGPINLNDNDNTILDAAFSLHNHPDSSHIGNVNVALENISPLQEFYNNNFEIGCVQLPTSIEEYIPENNLFEISPNPNNGYFSIFSKNNSENISLELFNLNGQKIWSGKINSGQKKVEINLSGKISSGVYFLKGVNANTRIFSQKIYIKK